MPSVSECPHCPRSALVQQISRCRAKSGFSSSAVVWSIADWADRFLGQSTPILPDAAERDGVEQLARQAPHSVVDHGFRTLVLNRTRRGGVLAPGASWVRHGENGGGLCSRWYPDTLAKRLQDIAHHADQLLFYEGDGVGILDTFAEYPGTRFFVDPPYTAAGGK